MKKENTYAELVCLLIIVFVVIAFCISLLYYGVSHLIGTSVSGSDIANIFVASATLLGPLILFLTFNSWKDQHKKKILDDNLLELWVHLENFEKLLFEINHFMESTHSQTINLSSDFAKEAYIKLQKDLLESRFNLYLSLTKVEMLNKQDKPMNAFRNIESKFSKVLLESFVAIYNKGSTYAIENIKLSYQLSCQEITKIKQLLVSLLDS